MRIQGTSIWLVAAMLFLGACSTSSTATTSALPTTMPATPVTTTTLPATTTTTSPATTTTTEPVEILLPNNDVEDPTEAIVAILEYVSYLHTIPVLGPEYLDLVYLESCDCYSAVIDFLNEYADKGWVQDDGGIVVEEAIVTQEFENGNVLLQITDSWSPQFVVDESGQRMRLERDEYVNKVVLFGLERGTDGRWRVGVTGRLGEIVGGEQ
ncbi:MAG: hypothetical protein P1T08_13125 [Acidimicrobiia bacterium]|nr:hypothetical protein [Acidimicrobiia bacterium]